DLSAYAVILLFQKPIVYIAQKFRRLFFKRISQKKRIRQEVLRPCGSVRKKRFHTLCFRIPFPHKPMGNLFLILFQINRKRLNNQLLAKSHTEITSDKLIKNEVFCFGMPLPKRRNVLLFLFNALLV